MAKAKTMHVCQNCGYVSAKWLGKCPDCGEWNTFQEEVKEAEQTGRGKSTTVSVASLKSKPESITSVQSGEQERMDTKIYELNRVLGGGLVKGSLTLISGDPGIGKSTLLLQCAQNIAKQYGKVLYVSGEESAQQIKMRANRLEALSEDLLILSETNIDNVMAHVDDIKPEFVIMDSIQTLYQTQFNSAPGSVTQVRECSNQIMKYAKSTGIPFFIVAHVTKQGDLAGPRVLEHMVDTVLSFEGDRTQEYRILRTVKNRFGTTSEIGVFEMSNEGLREVNNPSQAFLEDNSINKEGSAVIGVVEGTRPMLIEIQALVSDTNAPVARRTVVGLDKSRVNIILAVLEKKMKKFFYNKDVYINVVGGLNVEGTCGDLGAAVALFSSLSNKEVSLSNSIIIGEIGLTGEVRPVAYADRIVNEAEKLGFENVVMPKRNLEKIKSSKVNVIGVSSLKECIQKLF